MKTRQKVGEEEAYLFHVPLNMITLYTDRCNTKTFKRYTKYRPPL